MPSNLCQLWLTHALEFMQTIACTPGPRPHSPAMTSNIVSGVSYTPIWFTQEQTSDDEDGVHTDVILPTRLNSRWHKLVKNTNPQKLYRYSVTGALKRAKISRQKFLKCWFSVRSRILPDEVVSLFKDAGFGLGYAMKTSRRMALRVAFVRTILQRYKDMEVFRVHLFYLLFLISSWSPFVSRVWAH